MNPIDPPCERLVPTCSLSVSREGYHGLSPDSHTAQKLENASPEHLHITNRRYFVGPLPRGWLQSHRKSWYKSWLGFKDYSSKTATFSANVSPTQHRQLAGFLGPSTAARYRQSFPQPEDVDEDEEDFSEQFTPTEQGQVLNRVLAPVETPCADPQIQMERTMSYGEVERSRQGARSSTHHGNLGGSNPIVRISSEEQVPESYFTAPDHNQQNNASEGASAISSAKIGAQQLTNIEDHEIWEDAESADKNTIVPERGNSVISIAHEAESAGEIGSRASLLPHESRVTPKTVGSGVIDTGPSRGLHRKEPCEETDQTEELPGAQLLDTGRLSHITSGRLRFGLEEGIRERQRRLQRSISKSQEVRSAKRQKRQTSRSGEIVRAERMLVRIDTTNQSVPDDYNENLSIKLDTRTAEKWREYLVVCRQGSGYQAPFLLQMYETRVIPQVQISPVKNKSSHEVGLTKGIVKVNLFSSLDKTIVLWHPCNNKMGTARILIMRPRSAAHSVEWYTFIRKMLGWKPPSNLLVQAPDLNVSLLLQNPFEQLEHVRRNQNEGQDDCASVLQTMAEEQAIAPRIIKTCMNTLSECPAWADVLNLWSKSEKMGLAWRRYDRLEWVQGANEERMYGTIAMRNSHELELRPKQHYPTITRLEKGGDKVEEPPPIEGFLILLTSQTGGHTRWGKSFSKRLYFYSEDQYLCFCKPAKAAPPAPPKLPTIHGTRVPTSSEIIKETPIVYSIDPYPVKNGKISWISPRKRAYTRRHDEEAYAEDRRNAKNLTQTEGYLNLCRITEIRHVSVNGAGDEQNINSGDIEYHGQHRNISHHNNMAGSSRAAHQQHQDQSKTNRTLELVLENGLIVRLRAYNKQTRDVWMERLTELSQYWKARTRADVTTLKAIRQRNLEQLDIDEEQESMLGQFAQKWEVSRTEASPELFHTCGMSGCRSIKMSGHLYRKPRRRAAFAKCSVLLIEGQLLIFQGSLRKHSGEQIRHTHHSRQNALNLRDCYIYSGIITSSELLYQNQSFDSNIPGQHSTPRIYLSDGWTSADEDTATCFVIWHGARKVLFRGEEEDEDSVRRYRWRKVSALGVSGRSIVFKARSRAERDLWVLAIQTEIDRLQQQEDLRIVSKP